MTDRELLELAAKAAGMECGKYLDGWAYSSAGPHGEGIYKIDPLQRHIGNPRPRLLYWNPLTDDGDALRLAVRLDLDVMQAVSYKEVQIGGGLPQTIFQPWGDDKHAATRRAIVRAAASTVKQTSTLPAIPT